MIDDFTNVCQEKSNKKNRLETVGSFFAYKEENPRFPRCEYILINHFFQ